ncbi:MAG: response regulator [Acidobacteriota bacterium]
MKKNVLIVDDTLFMRTMLREIIQNSNGFSVAGEAATGREAIEKFTTLRPDVVTMDIVMPDMDGIEAMKKIFEIDPSAKVVMCSVLGQESLVIESIIHGARDFIVKPVNREKVLNILEGIFQDGK